MRADKIAKNIWDNYIFNVNEEWKKIEYRKELIDKLSEISGLKKLYFQSLTEKELQQYVNEYSKAGLL